jgi:predicted nucleic acid-binding protein
MNLVDSSGWLEYFGQGNNAEEFAPILQNSAELIVSAINLYEVFKRVAAQRGEEEGLQAVAFMKTAEIIDVDQEIALQAAVLSTQHHLAMADSLILATAQQFNALLWTQDEHFKGLEGVNYIPK